MFLIRRYKRTAFTLITVNTDLRGFYVLWLSISENDNNVRYVVTITCRWSQHRSTNMAKSNRCRRCTSLVNEWRYGRLDWRKWWVVAQVEACSNLWIIRHKTYACIATVNIQSANQPWQKRLHQLKVAWCDTSGFVHHENDVKGTG